MSETIWFEHEKYSEGQTADFTCKLKRRLCMLTYNPGVNSEASFVLQTLAFQEELEHCVHFFFFFLFFQKIKTDLPGNNNKNTHTSRDVTRYGTVYIFRPALVRYLVAFSF